MPIEAPGPLSEVTKPTVISAPKLALTDKSNAATPTHRRDFMTTSQKDTGPDVSPDRPSECSSLKHRPGLARSRVGCRFLAVASNCALPRCPAKALYLSRL